MDTCDQIPITGQCHVGYQQASTVSHNTGTSAHTHTHTPTHIHNHVLHEDKYARTHWMYNETLTTPAYIDYTGICMNQGTYFCGECELYRISNVFFTTNTLVQNRTKNVYGKTI